MQVSRVVAAVPFDELWIRNVGTLAQGLALRAEVCLMGLSRRAGWASALGRDKVGAVAWVVAGRRLRRSSPSGFAVLGRDLFWQRAFRLTKLT